MVWLMGLFVFCFLASLAGTKLVLTWTLKNAIMAQPNERSSHSVPTPHGGGLAIVAVLIPAWAYLGLADGWDQTELLVLLGGAALLAGFSLLDDLIELSAAVRFSLQTLVVGGVLVVRADDAPYFAGLLPFWMDLLVAGLGWIWFINLFNFMDGIDGIAGSQTATMALGVMVLVLFAAAPSIHLSFALVALACALGFLVWNWHPAKIFMGDVGSVPLGFLLAWLLLSLSQAGYLIPALILALYYLADATITLVRRALRGEKIWQAHREHFYQQAIKRGLAHNQVVKLILMTNLLLVGLAYSAAKGWAIESLLAALTAVAALLTYLGKKP